MARQARLTVAPLVVAILVLVAGAGYAAMQQPESAGIIGTYACAGTNPDGSTYTAIVEIAALTADVWHVRWTVPPRDGGPPIVIDGMGFFHGGAFVVAYPGGYGAFSINARTGPQIERLEGRWMSPPAPDLGTETLTRTTAAAPVSHPHAPGIRL